MRALVWIIAVMGTLGACSRQTPLRSGTITLWLSVYHDPKGDLYDSDHIVVCSLFFRDGLLLEALGEAGSRPNQARFRLIDGDRFAAMHALRDYPGPEAFRPVADKKGGALLSPPPVPGFEARVALADTAFSGHGYRRFAIADSASYSVFYVHRTDTVLPFSLASQFERAHGGVVGRIDTYDLANDRFVSLSLGYTDSIPEAYARFLERGNRHD